MARITVDVETPPPRGLLRENTPKNGAHATGNGPCAANKPIVLSTLSQREQVCNDDVIQDKQCACSEALNRPSNDEGADIL